MDSALHTTCLIHMSSCKHFISNSLMNASDSCSGSVFCLYLAYRLGHPGIDPPTL